MKYRITVEGEAFEIEVDDPSARPVIATVNGERFEVWPETAPVSPANATTHQDIAPALPADVTPRPSVMTPLPGEIDYDLATGTSSVGKNRSQSVLAPIPGTVVAISVKPGDAVMVGQELCVLDAMKMESPIRASRPGNIARIHVSEGENVKHHQLLMEYAD